MNEHQDRALAGCCGLYCGLCPRYQSKAPSRCLSCHLGEHHSYCSVWRCCVSKRGHHTCAECAEYPCERLIRVLGVEQGADSFISHKPAIPNLERIRQAGLSTYLQEQRERLRLVEHLLEGYNEGRSMSFYCRATALMPPDLVAQAIDRTEDLQAMGEIGVAGIKEKAKVMRRAIQDLADKQGFDLKLRQGSGEEAG